jgi:hypothetical protein
VPPGFSPDGWFLACYDGKEDGGISLVDAISAAPSVIERIRVPANINVVALAVDVDGRRIAIATRELDLLATPEVAPSLRMFHSQSSIDDHRPVETIRTSGTQGAMTLSYTADGKKLLLAARNFEDHLIVTVWDTEFSNHPDFDAPSRNTANRIVIYDKERSIWFKMFGGFKLQSEDRIILHVDYIARDAAQRSVSRERMLVLSADGEEVQRFEAGSSRMTISNDMIIFLDYEYWVCSWDGQGSPKRHAKLPADVGFAVSGLSFCEGRLTLISRTEGLTVFDLPSLRSETVTPDQAICMDLTLFTVLNLQIRSRLLPAKSRLGSTWRTTNVPNLSTSLVLG